MSKKNWKEKLDKKKILMAVCLSVAMLFVGLSLNVVAPPLGNEQVHWGFQDGEDLPPDEARGTSRYVDCVDGDDLNDGLSWVFAKESIQAAVNSAVSGKGDYIYVKACIYQEDVSISNIDNLHIIGEDEELVFVHWIHVEDASNIEIAGFNVNGWVLWEPPQTPLAITLLGVENAYIHDNKIFGGGAPMSHTGVSVYLMWTNNSKLFDNYIFSGGVAIRLWRWTFYNEIYNNDIHAGTGLWLDDEDPVLPLIQYNVIHDNRIAIYPAAGIQRLDDTSYEMVGIEVTDASANMFFNNQIGQTLNKEFPVAYPMRPVNDDGSANCWVNNHWSDWLEHFWVYSPGGETTLLEEVDTPGEGKVTVRLLFDLQAAVEKITLRVRDSHYGVLLAPPSEWTPNDPEPVFPSVEVSVHGGKAQFDVTIELPIPYSLNSVYVEILDD